MCRNNTENQQMRQNDYFIVMLSQTLLHVSAYHHKGAHMILTSYLYVGVHYRKNNGIMERLIKHHNKMVIFMHL
jgi:hypothetical protein